MDKDFLERVLNDGIKVKIINEKSDNNIPEKKYKDFTLQQIIIMWVCGITGVWLVWDLLDVGELVEFFSVLW